MTTSQDQLATVAGVFDFFALPPELRDAVYDQDTLCWTKLLAHNLGGRRVQRRSTAPLTNLLLVSHRFGEEYAARRRSVKTAMLEDCTDFDGQDFSVPEEVLDARQLKLRLLLGYPDGTPQSRVDAEVQMHRTWLPNFITKFHELRAIHLQFFIDDAVYPTASFEGLLTHLSTFTTMEKVEVVEVRLLEDTKELARPVDPSVRLAIWRAKHDALMTSPENLGYFKTVDADEEKVAQNEQQLDISQN